MSGAIQGQMIQEIAKDVREDVKEGIHMIQAKKMQERAHAFSAKTMKNKYQWAVGDLKKAGLNPMLAYMQPQSPMAGTALTSGVKGERGRGGYVEAMQANKNMELADESIKTQQTLRETEETKQSLNSALKEKALTESKTNESLKKKLDEETQSINYDNSARSVHSNFWENVKLWGEWLKKAGVKSGESVKEAAKKLNKWYEGQVRETEEWNGKFR